MMEYERVFSWRYYFRKQEFDNSASIEEFVLNTLSTYVKSPWYQNSQNKPPPLPAFLKTAFETIYSTIMDPINWFKYQPNLTSELRKAVPLAKSLPSQGVGVYCQDKSSRFCFASLQITNDKVESVLSDMVKYKKLQSDQAKPYQSKIKSWYRASKSSLVSIKDDLSSFLVPEVVSTPHLKVLVKTHKPDNGVRLTFSSKGSATQNLSTVLDHVYLKPTVTSDLCSRRLADTREALAFIESVNDYLWTNEIEVRPTIFATPHLKVLIKTHKPDNGVRLTFSSKGSATQNLSTVLDHGRYTGSFIFY